MRPPLLPRRAFHHRLPLPVTPRTPPRAPRRRPLRRAPHAPTRASPGHRSPACCRFWEEHSSPSSAERSSRGRRSRDKASPIPYAVHARVCTIIAMVRDPRRSRSGPVRPGEARKRPLSLSSSAIVEPRACPPVRPAAASSSSAARSSGASEGLGPRSQRPRSGVSPLLTVRRASAAARPRALPRAGPQPPKASTFATSREKGPAWAQPGARHHRRLPGPT